MAFWSSFGKSILGQMGIPTGGGGGGGGGGAPSNSKKVFHDEARRESAGHGAGTVGYTTSVEGEDPNAPKPAAAPAGLQNQGGNIPGFKNNPKTGGNQSNVSPEVQARLPGFKHPTSQQAPSAARATPEQIATAKAHVAARRDMYSAARRQAATAPTGGNGSVAHTQTTNV